MDGASPVLTLADGRKVLPSGEVVKEIEVPKPAAQFHKEVKSGRQAVVVLKKIHRQIGDLPDTAEKMNPIAAVITYTACGFSDADIATTLGATESQIKILKDSDAYRSLSQMFDKSVFDDAKRNAKHIIAKATDLAATRMVSAIDSDDPLISLAASRDVLKIGGVSLEEEQNKGSMSGLVIVVEQSGDRDSKITVKMGE